MATNKAVTNLQNLVFSELAYLNFENKHVGYTISDLLHGNPSLKDMFTQGLWPNTDEHKTALATYNRFLKQGAFEAVKDWKLVAVRNENTGNGFCGVAFSNEATGQVVIANRGTEFPSRDLKEDLDIVLGNALSDPNSQFASAMQFTQYVKSRVSPGMDITLTGHSLGGGLAQYLSVQTELNAVTFNAVGVGQLLVQMAA